MVEGKGKGLVAIGNISDGTVIFTEDPLIVYWTDDQDECVERFYQVSGYEQFKKMDPVKKQHLMEPYDPKEKSINLDFHEDSDYAKFCRIGTANDISINNKAHPGDVDLGLDVVYKQFFRINQSCCPNSYAPQSARPSAWAVSRRWTHRCATGCHMDSTTPLQWTWDTRCPIGTVLTR